MNFGPAVAYHFCVNLPEKVSQPWDHFFAKPCKPSDAHSHYQYERHMSDSFESPPETKLWKELNAETITMEEEETKAIITV